ncbi:cytochrome c-type biogenesis protein CcmH [Enterobacteriaceae bacterium ESL0689]|nr:cytochrome c-type biogenesis protein CcmH [Enterobacteriaceae bacterium ESL0689]
MKKQWLILLIIFISGQVSAVIDTWQFKDEAQEQQFRSLTEQLRCPKCQNNSIADSNSMIAADMRQKVFELMQQGQSHQQIIDYMVARYGNFVTYDPPLTAATLILWLAPILFILSGGMVIWRITRRRPTTDQQSSDLNAAEQQRLKQLLQDNTRTPPQ